MSQERDSLRRGQGRCASRLAGSQVSQAQSPASRVLRLAVPCPGHRIHPTAGGSILGSGRGAASSQGPSGRSTADSTQQAIRADPAQTEFLGTLGISVAVSSILIARLCGADARDVMSVTPSGMWWLPVSQQLCHWATATERRIKKEN